MQLDTVFQYDLDATSFENGVVAFNRQKAREEVFSVLRSNPVQYRR